MPKPAQGKGGQSVEGLAYGPAPAAAQRDVDVVANPGAQGDVPALPERGQVPCQVGPAEVLRQYDPVHPRKADCHVAVPTEVQQDTETEAGDEVPAPQDI